MPDMTPRPTHATVPADYEQSAGLTPGKKYALLDIRDIAGAIIIRFFDDDGDIRMGAPDGWLLTTEPPAEDDAATIARLERRVAVLREALEGVLPYARACIGLPENAWPTDNVILKARAALAETEGE